MPPAALTLQYYNNNNPFYNWDDGVQDYGPAEYYCWGRFWEVYNLYGARPQPPTNLGRVKRDTVYHDHTDSENIYENGAYWYDASVMNYDPGAGVYPKVVYSNLDNFIKPGGYGLGNIVCCNDFTPGDTSSFVAFTGIIEKIEDDTIYAAREFDEETGEVQIFDITDGWMDNVPIVGIIENPIYTMYDNIIPGHPMGWKWPFWMYKKLIERRRGL